MTYLTIFFRVNFKKSIHAQNLIFNIIPGDSLSLNLKQDSLIWFLKVHNYFVNFYWFVFVIDNNWKQKNRASLSEGIQSRALIYPMHK